MASEWFCLIGGEELGPLTVRQLRAMARDGRLGPEDVVRRGREGRWVYASRVQGLFAAQAASSAGADAASQPAAQPAAPEADASPQAPARSQSARASASETAAAGRRPPRKPSAAAPGASKPATAASKPVNAVGLPVARPAPTPSVPPRAAPRHTASAGVPVGAPSGAPVAVLAPADQPAAGALAARRPTRRRDNTALVVVALVILVLGLAAAGLGVYLWHNSSKAADRSSQGPGTAGPGSGLSGQQGSEASTAGGSAGGPGEQADDGAGAERWVDASRESARVGDVTVKVLSATVDRPRVLRSSGRGARPTEPYLVLRLQLENLRESHKLEYTTWASSQMRVCGVRLTDNLGNTYEPKTFTGVTIEGQLGRESLYPHEPVTEVLVFERPVESEQLRYLRLELPAMAFGEIGRLRFEIPAEMIERAPEPSPEPQPEGPVPEPEPPVPPEQPPEPPTPGPGQEPTDIYEALPDHFPELQQSSGEGTEERPEIEPGDRPDAPRLVPTPDQHRERGGEEPLGRGREEGSSNPFEKRSPFGNAL